MNLLCDYFSFSIRSKICLEMFMCTHIRSERFKMYSDRSVVIPAFLYSSVPLILFHCIIHSSSYPILIEIRNTCNIYILSAMKHLDVHIYGNFSRFKSYSTSFFSGKILINLISVFNCVVFHLV